MIGMEIIDEVLKNGFAESLTVKVVSLRLLLAVIFGGIVGYTRETINLQVSEHIYWYVLERL